MADWPTSPPTVPPSGGPGRTLGGVEYPSGPPEHWPAHAPPPWGAPSGPSGSGPSGFGPSPSAPPDPGSGGRRGVPVAVTAVVVVLVLALVIVGIGALATSDGSDEASDTTVDLSDPAITAPPSEDPLVPTVPGLDPGAGARPLDEVLPELIAFVEETREQQFTSDPVVEAVPAAEFEQRLAEGQAEDLEDLDVDAVAQVALGLVPPDTDLGAATDSLGASSVLGFFDPDTKELLVKGDQVTPFVQAIIVHELVHALDDQIFGLGGLEELAERPDESAFGFLALVEGTASHVQDAFTAQLSPEDADAYAQEELALGYDQMTAVFDIPPSLLVSGQVPYVSGQAFVEALVDEGGMAAVDAAYDDPPTTSEQILQPELYLAGEAAVGLGPLEAPEGVEIADSGAFGAADLRLLDLVADPMGMFLDPESFGLLEPVQGFGGGKFVSWTDGATSCIAVEAVGDDAAGSATIAELFDTWSAAVPGAEVGSRPGGSGVEVITATSCV